MNLFSLCIQHHSFVQETFTGAKWCSREDMKLGSSPGELTTCLGERCTNREIMGLRFCSQGTQRGETAEGGKGLQDREQHMQSSKA